MPLFLLRAFGAILSTPKLLRLTAAPLTIGFVSFLVYLATSFVFKSELALLIISIFTDQPDGWLVSLSGWAVLLLLFPLSALLAVLTMLTLGGVFFERIVLERLTMIEVLENAPVERYSHWLKGLLRSLRDDVIRLVVVLLLLAISALFSFVPILFFVPIGLAWIMAGADLFDTPLLLCGFTLRERLEIMRGRITQVAALGGCITALLLIPFAAIVALPAAYVTAADVVGRWKLNLPEPE